MKTVATMTGLSKAIFLDRDGTIVYEVGFIDNADDLELFPGTADALARAKALGFRLVVITNQSGVARGLFPEDTVVEINNAMQKLLVQARVVLDGIYYCPHHPEGTKNAYKNACDCRKPAPGMIKKASEDIGLDLKNSYMIGDKLSDIQSGINAGLKTILVRTGYGKDTEISLIHDKLDTQPDAIVDTLPEAIEWIINETD